MSENRYTHNEEESWVIDLMHSDMYWYEWIEDKKDFIPNQKFLQESHPTVKYQVENELHTRFIYFIATRTKVRFSTLKQPKYSFSGNNLYLYLEIGKEKTNRRIELDIYKCALTKNTVKPQVVTTGKYITFIYEDMAKFTLDIHDFLLYYAIDLGINTSIHTIGFINNIKAIPKKINEFTGNAAHDEDDTFLYYNLFKVITLGTHNPKNTSFIANKNLSDELKVNMEGSILEQCLNLYFETKQVDEKIESEINLRRLAQENHITKVTVHYELEKANEYFKFCSDAMSAQSCHLFTYQFESEALVMNSYSHPPL